MVTGLGKAGAFMPGGMDSMKIKGDTGHRKTAKERAEERKKKKKRKQSTGRRVMKSSSRRRSAAPGRRLHDRRLCDFRRAVVDFARTPLS